MSTRSNIILITPDNKVHQLYHHFDGYLSGVGEDLRRRLVYAIGICTITDSHVYNVLIDDLSRDSDYESECIIDLDQHNHLHGDIEFLYVIKDCNLYYVNEYSLCSKFNTNKDLIDYVCTDRNKLDLVKHIDDND